MRRQFLKSVGNLYNLTRHDVGLSPFSRIWLDPGPERLSLVQNMILSLLSFIAVQTSGVLHRPGIDLPYTVYGQGAPVVLISGGPGFTTDYELRIMKGCGIKGLQWIFLEQRGTPRARLDKGTEKDFAMSEYLADFEALRKQLRIEQWTLIGHSWGSMVAHSYIAEHPNRVRSVVFLGNVGPDTSMFVPAGDNVDRMLNDEERAAQAAAGATAINGPAGDDEALKLFLFQLPGYFYDRKATETHRSLFRSGCLVGNTQNLVLPALMRQNWDVSKAIAKYRGPVMSLQGRQDLLGETPSWKDKIAMPQTEVVFVERSGHMPWFEQPKPFFEALDRFLGENAK